MIDFNTLLQEIPQVHLEPSSIPISIAEIDSAQGQFDMDLPVIEPCPLCAQTRMTVGSYVCWGTCFPCLDAAMKESEA